MFHLTDPAADVAVTKAWLIFDAEAADEARAAGLVWRDPWPARARRQLARCARAIARKAAALWDGCPGPWPVKVVLVALAVAEPGPFGEFALVALSGANAARKARKATTR